MHHYATTIWSDNDELFRKVTKDWAPEDASITGRRDTNGKACIFTYAEWFPRKAIERLSAVHPEMTFTARNSDDYNPNASRDYFYEFKAGEGKLVNVQANYAWPVFEGINDTQASVPGSIQVPDKATVGRLEEIITEVFRRIDVTTGEGEKMNVNFYDGEVSVTTECDGWKMKATKSGSYVFDVKLYRKIASIGWVKLNQNIDDDIPL